MTSRRVESSTTAPVLPAPPGGAELVHVEEGAWRPFARLALAALLALSTLLLLVSLCTMQLTQRGPAERLLRQELLVLTEADALLDLHYQDLRDRADAGEEGPFALPNFPLDLTFTADELRSTTREQFRDLLLDRAAALVYEGGAAVLREHPESREPAVFSTPGAIRVSMDVLSRDSFDLLRVLTFSLAGTSAALALALALVTRGYGRLAAIGASLSAASVPFMLGAVAVRYGLRVGKEEEEEYLAHAFLDIGAEASWIAIRNGIGFAVLSASFLLAGLALAMWSDSRSAAVAGHQQTV